jgi:hypothetical protein
MLAKADHQQQVADVAVAVDQRPHRA